MNQKIRWFLLVSAIGTGVSFGQQNPAPFTLQTAKQSAVDVPAATATSSTSPTPTVSPLYHDALGRVVVQGENHATCGLRYDGANINFSEIVDEFGNRTRITANSAGLPVELKHEFVGRPTWNERRAYDASGGLLLSGVDSGESTLPAKAAQFGIQGGFPDWVQVNFARSSVINQVDVITRQDYAWTDQAVRPRRESELGGPTLFKVDGPGAGAGITDYEVQYLNASGKWIMIPDTYITNNRHVARTFIFAPITTTAIRLVVKGGGQGFSRVVEIEAFEKDTRRNVALASQGGSAIASSTQTSAGHTPAAVINGDEIGRQWGAGGGGWRDDTADIPPPPATVSTIQEYNGAYTRTNLSNQFATVSRVVNNQPPPTTPPRLGMQFMVENVNVSYSGGHSFWAGTYITKWGIEYWDSSGGSRIQYYDANKRLFYVTDWTEGWGHQPVVRINRDTQGRPTDVYLGNHLGLLQFVYDDLGWVYTRLINLTTNTPYFVFIRRGTPPAPMSYPKLLHLTHGYMPEYGPIIEWHEAISPIPNIVASLKGMPYALLPTTQSGFVTPARWVITPFAAEQEPMTNIRVEYDAENIYLQVPTLNSGSMVLGKDMQAFRFVRNTDSQAARHLQPRPESESATPSNLYYGELFARIQSANWGFGPRATFTTAGLSLSSSLEGSKSGYGAGGSGGGGGDDGAFNPENDLQSCGDCSDTITVTGKYPGVWFPFDPFPTRPPPPPQPPPEPPPGPVDVPQVNECNDDGSSSSFASSAAASPPPSSTPCPTPGGTPAPCIPFIPQTLPQQQADWTKRLAAQAMTHPRCADFVKNPGGARPPENNPNRRTYLQLHGYTGNQATLTIRDQMRAQQVWNNMRVYNGTGSGNCPPCGQAGFFVNSGNVFACPEGLGGYASQGANGGYEMQASLIHEYLHLLGLKEYLGTPATAGYPTSAQIRNATIDACLPGIQAAQGTSTPPH